VTQEPDQAEIWGKRVGRILAFAAAAWLAFELGQYLKIW
jgi:hypothetical protein